jgi:hypothetical protein
MKGRGGLEGRPGRTVVSLIFLREGVHGERHAVWPSGFETRSEGVVLVDAGGVVISVDVGVGGHFAVGEAEAFETVLVVPDEIVCVLYACGVGRGIRAWMGGRGKEGKQELFWKQRACAWCW